MLAHLNQYVVPDRMFRISYNYTLVTDGKAFGLSLKKRILNSNQFFGYKTSAENNKLKLFKKHKPL